MIDLVIRISEEEYDEILNGIENAEIAGVGLSDLSIALKNGILLPRGHGRLIDADALLDDITFPWYIEGIEAVKNAETIIEADKEESEEQE